MQSEAADGLSRAHERRDRRALATFHSLVELRRAQTFLALHFDAAILPRARSVPPSIPPHGAPRGLEMLAPRPSPTLAERAHRAVADLQGAARPADCDAHGRLKSRLYMAYVFGALSHIFAQLRTGDDAAQ